MTARKASAKAGSKPSPKAAEAEVPFEVSLERLEAVVDRLESGDLQLEDSLEAFEEGVRLSRVCSKQLEAAEARIEVLSREGDRWLSEPLDPEDSRDEGSADAEDQ